MSGTYFGEVVSLKTADGRTWTLPDGERFATAYGGFGAPPTTFVTNTNWRAHNAFERGLTFEPTTITLTLHQITPATRSLYWAARAELIDLLRQNRGGPLTLTIQTPGGVSRSLAVYADPGAQFAARDPGDDAWLIEEELSLTAFTPLWYDPARKTVAAVRDATGGLTFPITFPITFGAGGVRYTMAVPYAGTFESFPTITLTGPYSYVAVRSDSVDATFALATPISAGQQRIISLDPQNRTIVDGAGVDCMSELEDGFDLVHFRLVPPPYSPNGAQIIIAQMQGSTLASAASLAYYDRFIGL